MKKSFALRVDSEVYDAIERWAADEFRSTNGQIEWILSEALKKAKRHPKSANRRGEAPNAPEKGGNNNPEKEGGSNE